MSMDLGLAVRVGGFLLSVAAFVLAMMANRRKEVEGRFDTVVSKVDANRARIEKAEQRIATAENTIKHLPSRAELHQLHVTMTELSGQINVLNKALDARESEAGRINQALHRLEDYLREADKR